MGLSHDPSRFIKFKPKNSRKVKFGDDRKAKTIEIRDVGKYGTTFIHNIFLVDNLGYNLLSVNQLYDRNFYVLLKNMNV